MNVLLTSIGRRGYLADYFRDTTPACELIIGTTDRHSRDREFTVGLSSCDKSYLVPSVEDDGYIDAILDICNQENVDILCSMLDIDNYILSGHLDEFKKLGVLPFVSSLEVNKICLDKYLTFLFLKEHGFSTPKTFITVDNLADSDCRLPVIIKPRKGCASEGITLVETMDSLERCFIQDFHVIQEMIVGDEYGLDIFNDLNGRLLAYVAKKKIRMRAGETDQAVTVKDQMLDKLARRIGNTLGHFGPMDVDVLISEHGMSIIDFNPRFGGGYPLAHTVGANFPQLMVDITMGNSPAVTPGRYDENVVMLKDAGPKMFSLDKLDGMIHEN